MMVFTLIVFFSYKRISNSDAEIASLNTKYNLISVEALGQQNEKYSSHGYVFNPNYSKANVLGLFKPETELVVKLKGLNDSSSLDNVFVLRLGSGVDPKELAKQYESLSGVLYAEPNFPVELSDNGSVQIDTKSKISRSMNKLKNPNSIIVAVIDSGIDSNHKDLKNQIIQGYDFVSNDKDTNDNYGHGTHIAGIIASQSSAKIMPVKFTNGKIGKISDLAKAINFAVNNKANVINLSLAINENSALLKNSVDYAVKNNIYVVAAAGNYNTSEKYYPAAYSNVISVTGLSNDGTKLPQSNFGTWVDYSVKAQDILSTIPGGGYGYGSGTSEAVPFVSAKIVKILEARKNSDFNLIISDLNKFSFVYNTGHFSGLLGRSFK